MRLLWAEKPNGFLLYYTYRFLPRKSSVAVPYECCNSTRDYTKTGSSTPSNNLPKTTFQHAHIFPLKKTKQTQIPSYEIALIKVTNDTLVNKIAFSYCPTRCFSVALGMADPPSSGKPLFPWFSGHFALMILPPLLQSLILQLHSFPFSVLWSP